MVGWIGLEGKLKGFQNSTALFGLVSDKDTFIYKLEIPARKGGNMLWSYLRGVKEERGTCS